MVCLWSKHESFTTSSALQAGYAYRAYDFFSGLAVSGSVLDEHPVATPQVGSPAFRMRNLMTNQTPTISRIAPTLSTITLLFSLSVSHCRLAVSGFVPPLHVV